MLLHVFHLRDMACKAYKYPGVVVAHVYVCTRVHRQKGEVVVGELLRKTSKRLLETSGV